MREIRIYMEGGGDSKGTWGKIREGMDAFLSEQKQCARDAGVKVRVIPRGGRRQTYDDFLTGCDANPDALNLLLVDAEAPVAATRTPKQHLQTREGDKWPCPGPDDRYHLMVQTMEAWFMADQDAVAAFYGQGFNRNALRGNPQVEQIPKLDLEQKLKAATKATKKETYHKIKHGAELLKKIDPSKVRAAAPYCDRLFTTVAKAISGRA